jgi:hypothetical protein
MITALPSPEELAHAITRAMTAGNGRSHIVKNHTELAARLREDGFEFKSSELFAALSVMIEDGTHRAQTGRRNVAG